MLTGGEGVQGSSPLARGLRRPQRRAGNHPGIIPARAGFTPIPSRTKTVTWDHPRSRGVYRRGGIAFLRGGGIIPARAGFTYFSAKDATADADHPRSRGVYCTSQKPSCDTTGSSPLARGLRHLYPLEVPDVGIIPARAGFTTAERASRRPPPDHPRSRGVYRTRRRRMLKKLGSSPLARGLLEPNENGDIPSGIIPARAGFTFTRTYSASSLADHPRSRGVYQYCIP